jgi:GT2 family glycosyltransferase
LLSISVIVPVFNGGDALKRCLRSIAESDEAPLECIVVDDGSTDGSERLATLSTGGRRGPAAARNMGARHACGDLLVFVDGDVLINRGTLSYIRERFERDAALDTVIGSYDDQPEAPGFISQYKNLAHHYVHQRARRDACTFWTGCGAVRRQVFLDNGGFDERFRAPSIEDIEFGYRLSACGRKLALDPSIQVTHLKSWTFCQLLRTDVFYRAIPWTLLMLGNRRMPNDLNVSIGQRLSVWLTFGSVAAAALGLWPAAAVCLGGVLASNSHFYAFLAQRRGFWFGVRAVPMHLLYLLYSGVGFAVAVVKRTAGIS